MTLSAGVRLGPYEIIAALDAGGMGEVYRARDPRIGRDVAIKVLPSSFSQDRDRLRRFEQEARAAGALNHPALLTVHDVGEQDGTPYLVSELLEGETLRTRLRGGRLAPRRAIEYAIQIARGLAAAYEKGIIHRDIKPENIFITKDGRVKILDFGLAKLRQPREGGSKAPTMPNATDPGAVMGTAAYMSPEQVRGDEVDQRSDIFSLGTVLYECLTGKAPFKGDSSVETMSAILKEDPPEIAATGRQISPALNKVVARCLEKHREARYQSAADLAFHLEDVSDISTPAIAASRHPFAAGVRTLWQARFIVLVSIAVLAIAAAVLFHLPKQSSVTGQSHSSPEAKVERLTTGGNITAAAMTPDGRYLVYAAANRGKQSLHLMQLSARSDVELIPPAEVHYRVLHISSDGDEIYYTTWLGELWHLPLLGGRPARVAQGILAGGFAISPHGDKLACIRQGDRKWTLVVMSTDGSNEEEIVVRDLPQFIGMPPAWSPDGTLQAVGDGDFRPALHAIVSVIDLRSRKIRALSQWEFVNLYGVSNALTWMPDGKGLLVSGSVPSEQKGLDVWYLGYPDGTARKVVSDLASYPAISVTADGSRIGAVRSEDDSNLLIVDPSRRSAPKPLTAGARWSYGLRGLDWTPQNQILYTSAATYYSRSELWSMNADGTNPHRLLGGVAIWPAVSPDGSTLVFASDRNRNWSLWVSRIDGSGVRQLPGVNGGANANFSPDGRWVYYLGTDEKTKKVRIDGGVPVDVTKAGTTGGRVSPDGKLLVCRYPGIPATVIVDIATGQPRKIFKPAVPSTSSQFRWTRDAKAFVYIDSGNLWRQSIAGGDPVRLTDFDSGQIMTFDWSPDQSRLVISRRVNTSDAVVIRNFR